MTLITSADRQRFVNSDLVLKVSDKVDVRKWDEDRYDAFLTALCLGRDYQRAAISTTLRYLLSGEYDDLEQLSHENFESNPVLQQRYNSWDGMKRRLTFPKKLAGTLDLATGTGKSFVMYGIAAVMLAEGIVDRVLVLCPSRTIEHGLTEKFKQLAENSALSDLMPAEAKWKIPAIRNANETIEEGFICIENYHAALEGVSSSIRDSLRGKGKRTLVLNDETHHVANKVDAEAGKWNAFLSSDDYGFRFVLGVTGTAYVGNDYFPDVLFRYSLKEALAENYVKKVRYVIENASTRDQGEKWQIIHNHHRDVRDTLKKRDLLPLTIVVCKDIRTADIVAQELRDFLMEAEGWDEDTASRNVLCVHSKNSGDVARLRFVDDTGNKVEWVVSVAMLTEGWDVKRVFGIVPHEERAFNSKLLISQVLGRALRVPDKWDWQGGPPIATVWNHEAFAPRIKDLVDEVLEHERTLTARVRAESEFHFNLHQLEYAIEQTREDKAPPVEPMEKYKAGIIDLSSDVAREKVTVQIEQAGTGRRTAFQSEIVRHTFTIEEIAQVLFERCQENSTLEHNYAEEWPLETLQEIVRNSLAKVGMTEATDKVKQRFLGAMGSLRRKKAKVARLNSSDGEFKIISTNTRRSEVVSASQVRNGASKRVFYTPDSFDTLESDEIKFMEEAIDSDNYQLIKTDNPHFFKTPLGIVIADSDPERRFIKGLLSKDNNVHFKAWLKSTSTGFYSVKYEWQKKGVQKQSNFNPDFFIKVRDDLICVVEIKADSEIDDVSEENRQKLLFARDHFGKINAHLEKEGSPIRYHFNFLTPSEFGLFFTILGQNQLHTFQSSLDAALLNVTA